MKFKVSGTIELNWQVFVDADSEQEAEDRAISLVMDGHGLGDPVEVPEADYVEELEESP